ECCEGGRGRHRWPLGPASRHDGMGPDFCVGSQRRRAGTGFSKQIAQVGRGISMMRMCLFIAGLVVCLAWPPVASCQDTQTLRTYRAAVRRLALSTDGKLLVTASYRDGKGELRIWDAAVGKLLRALEVGGHFPMSVAMSPDSKLLISGNTKGAIQCWD